MPRFNIVGLWINVTNVQKSKICLSSGSLTSVYAKAYSNIKCWKGKFISDILQANYNKASIPSYKKLFKIFLDIGLPKQHNRFRQLFLNAGFFGSVLSINSEAKTDAVSEKSTIRDSIKSHTSDIRSSAFKVSYVIYEAIRLFLRVLRLGLTFAPVVLLYPVTYLGPEAQEIWWKLLLLAIEFSGPIFIKFGQWVSTRRDLFPEKCCHNFSRLQRRANPHSWYYTKLILNKAFGKKWRKVFVKFDNNHEPVGSGCIAQVYKVWMCADNLENKDVIDEILQSDDKETILHLSDGLEVLGFHFWKKKSKQNEEEEEEKALEERRRTKMIGRESRSSSTETSHKISTVSEMKNLKSNVEKVDINLLSYQNKSYHTLKDITYCLAEKLLSPATAGHIYEEQTTVTEQRDALCKDYDKNAAIQKTRTASLGQNEIIEDQVEMQDVHDRPEKSVTSLVSQGDNSNGVPLVEGNPLVHALVEEWQQTSENLEKSLPVLPEGCDNVGLIPVAVKVVHPGVYRIFRRDILILQYCTKIITKLWLPLQWLALDECVQEFSKVMARQLDLRIEAENLEKFSESFSNIGSVRFPRPVRPFVTTSVLTETFEDGEPIGNFITDNKSEIIKKTLAKIGVDTLLKMIFLDNFVHADLHPGNILVQNYNSDSELEAYKAARPRLMMVDVGSDIFVLDVKPNLNPLRICLLDCGIVATLSEKNLENFKAVFKQVVLGDGKSVADLFLLNSQHDCKEPDSFREGMVQLVEVARKDSVSLGQVDVGLLLQQVLNLLLKHRIRLEASFSAVVLAVFVLEGLGRSLDPQMNILERARPILVTGVKSNHWS